MMVIARAIKVAGQVHANDFQGSPRSLQVGDELAEGETVITPLDGCVELERPDSFIPYESLSEGTVVGWVKDKLGSETVREIETNLAIQIDEQKNPKVESGTPWQSEFVSILAED
jgi:hypothetical protein